MRKVPGQFVRIGHSKTNFGEGKIAYFEIYYMLPSTKNVISILNVANEINLSLSIDLNLVQNFSILR